ncbi:MAG: PaaI family thioesterase [Armatimonadetes bacterium]|nr:MAG: PaaI family thioesterase [Armatimonadota bacterium]
MIPDMATIATLRREYATCFGCGSDNEIGIQLDGFTVEGSLVTAPFVPRPQFAGFAGILHGGVLATVLDEISAWSAMLTEGVFVFTATLDIRYQKKATVDEVFTLTGRVIERRGKRLSIEGKVLSGTSTVARSEGLFVVAKEVQASDAIEG